MLIDCGINFEKLALHGIEHSTFSEYFVTSGLVLNPEIHWYGFHTDHDFAYLLSIVTNAPLPTNEELFMEALDHIFPNLYDIKVIAEASFGFFRSSLATLAEKLRAERDDDCEH